jgi:hypothetical protein
VLGEGLSENDIATPVKNLPMAKIARSDPSSRVDRKAPLVVGDLICLQIHIDHADEFVTSLQNPLMAQSRLCALKLNDITRPFALVAVFKIEVSNIGCDELENGRITFGTRIKLRHVGTDQLLMVNPDKAAAATPAALHAFLHSESGIDPVPRNAYEDFVLEPKLKTRHEGDVVTAGEHIRIRTGPDGAHSYLSAMVHDFADPVLHEVSAVPASNDDEVRFLALLPADRGCVRTHTQPHPAQFGSDDGFAMAAVDWRGHIQGVLVQEWTGHAERAQ